MNGSEQRHGHAQPQDPSQRGKQRHVHVIENEHLIAEHRQAIQILRALLMRDCRDGSLQTGDMRLQCNGHLVAETALHPRAEGAQKPGCRRGDGEAERCAFQQHGPMFQDAFTEQHQPERQERIGQSGELRQRKRRSHQARLMAVSQLAKPPHGGKCGWQRRDPAVPVRRGHHRWRHPRLGD